jgi:hypothetical protein
MPESFELETREGIRRVQFDPDVFLRRDVRIIVDGKRAATMPYPKGSSPYQETTVTIGDHTLVAVSYVSGNPWPGDSWGLEYDLFKGDRSLTDQSPLTEVRERGRTAGKSYPGSFRFIDALLQIAPGAAGAGIGVAFVRRAADLGWPTAILVFVLLLGALGVGTVVAGRVWQRVRAWHQRSAVERAGLGCAAILICFALSWGGAIALALMIVSVSQS